MKNNVKFVCSYNLEKVLKMSGNLNQNWRLDVYNVEDMF